MRNFFKKLFRRKKTRKTYMYLIAYYDFFAGTTMLIKQPSELRLERQYPTLYGGSVSSLKMILIFEEDYYGDEE